MNRYNPYTVPDGFFENACQEALKRRAANRRRLRMAVGAAVAVVAVVLIVTPFVSGINADEQREVIASNQDRLADMYENDMFLLVSFE